MNLVVYDPQFCLVPNVTSLLKIFLYLLNCRIKMVMSSIKMGKP